MRFCFVLLSVVCFASSIAGEEYRPELLKLDGKKALFEDARIDMVGQRQIDFKRVDHGGIRIDNVRVYEGVF